MLRLPEFLLEAFSRDELIRLLQHHDALVPLRHEVREQGSPFDLATDLAGAAVRRGIVGDLLDAVEAERPLRADDIRGLRAHFAARDERPPQGRWTLRDVVAGSAALSLDRAKQWNMVTTCPAARSVVFLLYGLRGNAHFWFVDRIRYYFSEEVRVPHQFAWVPFRVGPLRASVPQEWERNLAVGLGAREGDARSCLQHALTRAPQVVILGLAPLSGLNEREAGALAAFLGTGLPALLEGATQPLRVVVPVVDRGDDDPLLARIRQACAGPRARAAYEFRELRRLSMPDEDDVCDWLALQAPWLSDEERTTILGKYRALVRTGGSFEELTDMLDELVGDR